MAKMLFMFRFKLGREQENGEISRLLHDAHAEEQAVSAAHQGMNNHQHGHTPSNTASTGSAGDSESFAVSQSNQYI